MSFIYLELMRGAWTMMLLCQNKFLFPFPEMRYKWFWKKSSSLQQRVQIIDPFGVFYSWRFLKGASLRYFFFKIWLIGWLLLVYIFHRIFPPKSRLESPGSLVYKPPSTRGRLIVSQLTRWNLFWLPFPPCHRKSLNNFETCSMMDFGASRKES